MNLSPIEFHDYHPKFGYQVKNSCKKLKDRCWLKNSHERSTFKKPFKKLLISITYKYFFLPIVMKMKINIISVKMTIQDKEESEGKDDSLKIKNFFNIWFSISLFNNFIFWFNKRLNYGEKNYRSFFLADYIIYLFFVLCCWCCWILILKHF